MSILYLPKLPHNELAGAVRRVLNNNTLSGPDDKVVESLLDAVITSTNETVKTVRELNIKLDKTYKELTRGNKRKNNLKLLE